MPHPPHKLAEGSADAHADDCERCKQIAKRWRRMTLPEIRKMIVAGYVMPVEEFNRIEEQFIAEDAQEAAKETK